MTKINIAPLKSTDYGVADLFNEKFAAIVEVLNGKIDGENIKRGSITAELMSSDANDRLYPVGTIYRNGLVNTNPAELLGFGTWEPWAPGRTTVSFDGNQTEFNAVGKEGGTKTVSLTAAQNGTHSHGVNDPGHSHGIDWGGDSPVRTSPGGTNNRVAVGGSGQQLRWGGGSINGSGTGVSIQNSGSGSPHENMPPFKVAYEWIRTS